MYINLDQQPDWMCQTSVFVIFCYYCWWCPLDVVNAAASETVPMLGLFSANLQEMPEQAQVVHLTCSRCFATEGLLHAPYRYSYIGICRLLDSSWDRHCLKAPIRSQHETVLTSRNFPKLWGVAVYRSTCPKRVAKDKSQTMRACCRDTKFLTIWETLETQNSWRFLRTFWELFKWDYECSHLQVSSLSPPDPR